MKIGIHHRVGSFSDRWIDYCKLNNINYKLVNCYESNIIEQLDGCDALMWHHHHGNYEDLLFAKQLLFSLESSGFLVFPDFKTGWYFDDKVGQKYLLESINAPMVPTHVFYEKDKALKWLKGTELPKVFKTRGGAGAINVKLVQSQNAGVKYIKKAFNNGFPVFNSWDHFSEKFLKFLQKKENFFTVLKAFRRFFIKPELAKRVGPQKGYIYFQDFIPNNNFDYRIIVVGNKAFGIKRMVRKNDFRASGSGFIIFDPNEIPLNCVKTAFNVNKDIGSQCVAFDFVINSKNEALVIEISYGFSYQAYDACPGYWEENLRWVEKEFNPQYWQIENLIAKKNQ